MKNRIYIICVHIEEVTIPHEAFHDEAKAAIRLLELRAETKRGIAYSLQYVPMMDGDEG